MSILVKGGTLVTAEHTYRADVLCNDGLISAVGSGLSGAQEW